MEPMISDVGLVQWLKPITLTNRIIRHQLTLKGQIPTPRAAVLSSYGNLFDVLESREWFKSEERIFEGYPYKCLYNNG